MPLPLEALRVDHHEISFPTHVVWLSIASLGGSEAARASGFEPFANRDQSAALPIRRAWLAGLRPHSGQIVIRPRPEGGVLAAPILELVTPDPHPADWLQEIEREHHLAVFASEGRLPPRRVSENYVLLVPAFVLPSNVERPARESIVRQIHRYIRENMSLDPDGSLELLDDQQWSHPEDAVFVTDPDRVLLNRAVLDSDSLNRVVLALGYANYRQLQVERSRARGPGSLTVNRSSHDDQEAEAKAAATAILNGYLLEDLGLNQAWGDVFERS